MNRNEWSATLGPLISPRAPLACVTQLGKMLQYLGDLPDRAFTEASLTFVAPKLPRSPRLGQLREALNGYLRSIDGLPDHTLADNETTRERKRQAEREAFLAHEWDDPAGIRERIRTCNGELKFLRLLAALVHRHAPQHLGLLPPAAIASVDEPAPEPGRFVAPPPRPAYFTPEQLRAVGGGRYGRSTAALSAPGAQPVDTDATDAVATAANDAGGGVYPARDT
jgi:hypothetical protein